MFSPLTAKISATLPSLSIELPVSGMASAAWYWLPFALPSNVAESRQVQSHVALQFVSTNNVGARGYKNRSASIAGTRVGRPFAAPRCRAWSHRPWLEIANVVSAGARYRDHQQICGCGRRLCGRTARSHGGSRGSGAQPPASRNNGIVASLHRFSECYSSQVVKTEEVTPGTELYRDRYPSPLYCQVP